MNQENELKAKKHLESMLKETREARILASFTDLQFEMTKVIHEPEIILVPILKKGILTFHEKELCTLFIENGTVIKIESTEKVSTYPQVGAKLTAIFVEFPLPHTFSFLFEQEGTSQKLSLSETEESGGSELYLDHQLVRKDGYFVDPILFPLNSHSK